ncbi:hypothetical protein GCM10007276_18110 [Agaricicola taiwanensis]|uniref:Uncharacterized protein n=1 Tax=Agaricicola taiwanensis TaxID=591372 RepID=A0A8J2VNP9_9RHOB|nr:hypothetical protein [Agaricicola taiwanensis]GGE41099.1 hypothetical protein GCM10007276_18110 [Agaricicola taiwanensis]
MTQPPEKTTDRGAAPTTDRLRHDIDQGRTGEKISYSDPAAAPLGTDDEAAGHPPSPAAIAHAHRQETAGGDHAEPGATDERGREATGELKTREKKTISLTFGLLIAVLAALVIAALLV